MSKDHWQMIRRYGEIQRQQLAERERLRQEHIKQQRLQEQAHLTQMQEALHQQQQRHIAQQVSHEQEAVMHQEARQKFHHFHIQHQSQELLRQDHQRNEAHVQARRKVQETHAQQPTTWQGDDGTIFQSPVEAAFWNTWQRHQGQYPLVCQYAILRYRVDFAHLATKTVIELDGRQYHTDSIAFTRDRTRQRVLMAQGWQVLRFSAREVHEDIERCVQETLDFLQR